MDLEYSESDIMEKPSYSDFDFEDNDHYCRVILKCICDFQIPKEKNKKVSELDFLLDNQEFIKTKRFAKFVQAAYDAMSDVVTEQVKSSNGGTLFDFCQDVIAAWATATIYNEAGEKQDLWNLVEKSVLQNLAAPFCNLSGLVAADMWAANSALIKGAAAGKDENDKYKIMKLFVLTCYTKHFDDSMNNAIVMTCYEYVYENAIKEGGFTEGNWFSKLKEIDRSTAFLMLIKTLKYTLHDMESIISTYINQDSNEDIKEMVKLASDIMDESIATKSLQEKFDTISDELKEKDRQLSLLRGSLHKMNGIKDKLDKVEVTIEEQTSQWEEKVIALQKENNRLRAEKEELEEKYRSAQEFADCLSLEDTDEGQAVDTVSIEAVSNMRIVFIRDNDATGYTMMNDLADKFPNARFTNHVASDINAKTTDLVVLLTRYIKHATYYGVKGFCKAQELACIHSNYTNVDKITEDIVKAFS